MSRRREGRSTSSQCHWPCQDRRVEVATSGLAAGALGPCGWENPPEAPWVSLGIAGQGEVVTLGGGGSGHLGLGCTSPCSALPSGGCPALGDTGWDGENADCGAAAWVPPVNLHLQSKGTR